MDRHSELAIPTCIYKITPFNEQTTSNFYNPNRVVPVHQLFFTVLIFIPGVFTLLLFTQTSF